MNPIAEDTLHDIYLNDHNKGHISMVLKMINYVQFEYPPEYLEAVNTLFPDLFDEINVLVKEVDGYEVDSTIAFYDEEIYTIYIAYDLMGRLMISGLYDALIADLHSNTVLAGHSSNLNRFSLTRIRPLLKSVEFYAALTGSLPELQAIRADLSQLPLLE